MPGNWSMTKQEVQMTGSIFPINHSCSESYSTDCGYLSVLKPSSLPIQRPPLGHYWGDNLTRSMLMTVFCY